MTWQIKDWDTVFENRRSRVVDSLKWVQWPVHRDGESYRRLMATGEGMIAYAVFATLVRIAAHCPVRGVLADDKGDITPERVSLRVGSPVETVKQSMEVLASKDIAWIVAEERRADGARTARDGRADGAKTATHYPTQPESTGQNTRASGTEGSSIPNPGSGGSDKGWEGVHPVTVETLRKAGGSPERLRELIAARTGVSGVGNPLGAAVGIYAKELGVKLNGSKKLTAFGRALQRSQQCQSR